jgi:hypothetical protein
MMFCLFLFSMRMAGRTAQGWYWLYCYSMVCHSLGSSNNLHYYYRPIGRIKLEYSFHYWVILLYFQAYRFWFANGLVKQCGLHSNNSCVFYHCRKHYIYSGQLLSDQAMSQYHAPFFPSKYIFG